MRLGIALLLGSLVVVAIGVAVWIWHESPTRSLQEVQLSAGLRVDTNWLELRPPTTLRTVGDWSELLLELPSLDMAHTDDLIVEGSALKIEAYLNAKDGERVQLDKATPVGFDNQKYVRLSSPSLEWKKRDHEFVAVGLRCSRPVDVGKVIWISYDPRAFKDGVAFPSAAK